MATAVFIKIWLGFFNLNLGKKINSATLKATAADSFCDVAATCAVLVGLSVGLIFNINIEGYTGTIVAGFIIYTGITAVRDTLSPLLGEAPDREFVEEIKNTVTAHKGVLDVHDLIVHDYGPGRKMISLHAEVRADEDILKTHDMIDNIEVELRSKFNCQATIHMDPIDTECELTNELKEKVGKIINDIDEKLTFHDFRTVSGPTHTNLIFDVAVPFSCEIPQERIKSEIRKKVSEINENYFCIIEIDRLI